MNFFRNLFGKSTPVAPEAAEPYVRNFDEWQSVNVLIPLDEDFDPDDEYQPWMEVGAELAELVSDSGLGDYTGGDFAGDDNLLMFECADATAMATFIKEHIADLADEDLPKGSRMILMRKVAGQEEITEEIWSLD